MLVGLWRAVNSRTDGSIYILLLPVAKANSGQWSGMPVVRGRVASKAGPVVVLVGSLSERRSSWFKHLLQPWVTSVLQRLCTHAKEALQALAV